MNEYHKIQSIYKRDDKGRFRMGFWSEEWMAYLATREWLFTEKVDGTNIRVAYSHGRIIYGGRTGNAQIPAKLIGRLDELFSDDLMFEHFEYAEEADVCLYGEGFGAGIQKGGGLYRDRQSFILFDVKVGDWWLKRSDVVDVARKLGIDVVPVIGVGTLLEAASMVLQGFPSKVARAQKGQDLPEAEGLVCRPAVDLFDRGGRRIIVKVKTRDMRRAVTHNLAMEGLEGGYSRET